MFIVKNSLKIAVCAVFTAMSVVLLFIGGAAFVLVYLMPMITSLLMIILRKTFGVSAAMITYTATSILSFILVPDRECMLMYVLFFGYYPVIYPSLEKIKALKWAAKFLIFNSMVALIQLALIYVFGIPFLEEGEGIFIIVIFAALMNILFVIYDFVIKNTFLLYEKKLEKRIKKYFK